MPNPSELQNRFNQNGHARNGYDSPQDFPDTNPDWTQPSQSKSPPVAEKSSSVGDDWSLVTQELIDTVPQVWTRGLLYMLVTFTAIALPWAMLSKVDETGTARGRLEPKGKTLELDAPVAGKVAALKVKEGQTVMAGQILMELESEINRADLQQALAKREGQLNRIGQLNFMRNQLLQVTIPTQEQQSKAEAAALLAQIDQTRQRLSHGKIMQSIAKDGLARDQSEVQRYRRLVQEGIVPAVKVIEVERAMDESKGKLNQAQLDIAQAQDQIKAQQSQYEKALRAGELTVLDTKRQIKELESQIADLQAEIAQNIKLIGSLNFQLQQRTVRAPGNGTIFHLSVNNAGAVLQPGQMIAQIAPQEAPLVLRAQMTSRESGFLRVGMPVKLKFDAYPFQDYGIVEGRLSWVSPDSKITQAAEGSVETFEVEVALDRTYIQTQNKRIDLTPGQTATAEVIVRQRRIIDFLVDPFKKLQKGGLKL